MGERRWKGFLGMSVEERNRVVDLSLSIRNNLKRISSLKELGLRGSWDQVDLRTILGLSDGRVARVVTERGSRSALHLLRDLRQLRLLMGSSSGRDEPSGLDRWMEPSAG